MAKQPPISNAEQRSEEARINRLLRIASMAILLSPIDMIFGLSLWIGSSLILLAVLLFIWVYLLDRRLSRRVCNTSTNNPTKE